MAALKPYYLAPYLLTEIPGIVDGEFTDIY